MTEEELKELAENVQNSKFERQTLEIKSAAMDAPKIYDTLSSFSNQNQGGTILYGLDEKQGFKIIGVYDKGRLQNRISEQCEEMEPVVRPVITSTKINDQWVLAAEIPGISYAQRPCFQKAKGIIKGSYIRVGEFDKQMTPLEIYQFESFRMGLHPEEDVVERAEKNALDVPLLETFLDLKIKGRPKLAKMGYEKLPELFRLVQDSHPTKLGLLLCGTYPQMFYPDFCITAISCPTAQKGQTRNGIRFLDSARIEGTIMEMIDTAFQFVKSNLKTRIVISSDTGHRIDDTEIPGTVLREAIVNALIHRDYSDQAQSIPVRMEIFPDRVEISNPGGLYGGQEIDTLGKILFPKRNPHLAAACEMLEQSENRGSGIPAMIEEMEEAGLSAPVFSSKNGIFTVILYRPAELAETSTESSNGNQKHTGFRKPTEPELLEYCQIPRSRKEIASYFGYASTTLFIRAYVEPLVQAGKIHLTIPENISSRKQKFFTNIN